MQNIQKSSVTIRDKIEVAVKLKHEEDTTLTNLDVVSIKTDEQNVPNIFAVNYTVTPGPKTTISFPEVEIQIEFSLTEVVRIMPPADFGACSRIGLWYDNSWSCRSIGTEPFVLYVDAAGGCRYLVGASNLELACEMRAHVYGGPEHGPGEIDGVKGIGRITIKRNCAKYDSKKEHYKGKKKHIFRDTIYIDIAGGNCYAAVRRYFTWLRENYYPESMSIPEGSDEVQWNTWYALQANIDQKIIEEQAQCANNLGIRRINIDAFWDVPKGAGAKTIWGNYRADPERFPDFKELVDKLHANGQKISVHTRPFLIDLTYAELQYLEPFLLDPGYEKTGDLGFLLCPCCKETREHILSNFQNMVEKYGIDEFFVDFLDDFIVLYSECHARDHNHLPGSPGQHVISIVKDLIAEVHKINPKITFSFRRGECTPITRQFITYMSPHDRYLDYLGNLRECLFVRQLSHRELVQSVCSCWPMGEKPEVVARHMIAGIFAGVPAISVDLIKQSKDILRVIKTYVDLYRANKSWLNYAERRVLCPEDAIRAIAIDGPQCTWALCTGTVPGSIMVPKGVQEITIFSSSFPDITTFIPILGEWQAVGQDYLMNNTEEIKIEQVKDGIFVHTMGKPLFSVKMTRSK